MHGTQGDTFRPCVGMPAIIYVWPGRAGPDLIPARGGPAARLPANLPRHRAHERLESLDLILDTIGDAALQNPRNVLIQLAVLMPESGHRDHHGRVDLPQLQRHLP